MIKLVIKGKYCSFENQKVWKYTKEKHLLRFLHTAKQWEFTEKEVGKKQRKEGQLYIYNVRMRESPTG